MKFIDEKGRLFGKINIFDFIVLAAVILVVGAVGYKLIQNNNEKAGNVPTKMYIVTVKSSAMPDTFAQALQKDDRIYFDSDGFVNAKIIDIREEPAKLMVETADGRVVEAESTTLKDVYVDMEVDNKQDTPDIKVGRYAVAVGGKFTIKTIYAMGPDSIVTDIKEK